MGRKKQEQFVCPVEKLPENNGQKEPPNEFNFKRNQIMYRSAFNLYRLLVRMGPYFWAELVPQEDQRGGKTYFAWIEVNDALKRKKPGDVISMCYNVWHSCFPYHLEPVTFKDENEEEAFLRHFFSENWDRAIEGKRTNLTFLKKVAAKLVNPDDLVPQLNEAVAKVIAKEEKEAKKQRIAQANKERASANFRRDFETLFSPSNDDLTKAFVLWSKLTTQPRIFDQPYDLRMDFLPAFVNKYLDVLKHLERTKQPLPTWLTANKVHIDTMMYQARSYVPAETRAEVFDIQYRLQNLHTK